MFKCLSNKEDEIFGEIKYSKDIFSDYKAHFHSMFCLGVVEKGALHIKYKNKEVTLNSNEIAIFNPYEIHKTTNIDASGYYAIYLDLNWCRSIQSELFVNLSSFIPIQATVLENNQIVKLCKNILNSDNNYEYIKELIDIVKNIFLKYSYKNLNKDITCKLSDQIKDYINKNIDSKLSIGDISSKLGYNKSYLIRVFKKANGITPQDYIINKKIDRAKRELSKSKETTIVTIAYNNGFYDQSHFNRNFKKIFALTPKIYKKSI